MGRPTRGRRTSPHRPRITRHTPVHVTLRLRPDLPNLRRGKLFHRVRSVLRTVAQLADFRVCHFSVQGNHVHLLCEAESAPALAQGVHRFATRLAWCIADVVGHRRPIFAERYHARILASPRETRNALRYVLLNGRRHARGPLAADWFDPCSSAAWFDGWKEELPWREPWMRELQREESPVAQAKSWLLREGWRKRGLLSLREIPGEPPPLT